MTHAARSAPFLRIAVFVAIAIHCFGPVSGAEPAHKTENVIVITFDGLRWQELFSGADETLMNKEDGGVREIPALKERFWRDTPEERRAALLPFFWKMIAKQGQVFGDPSLPGEVSMDHVHLYPREADIPAMQAWYAKVFGGFPGQRQRVARPGVIDVDYFGRFNLSFSPAMGTPQPTRGRGIDHIGFDVKDIDVFAKRLEGMGLKFDAPPRQAGTSSARVAFFTDPWGTYIEVTEKLAP